VTDCVARPRGVQGRRGGGRHRLDDLGAARGSAGSTVKAAAASTEPGPEPGPAAMAMGDPRPPRPLDTAAVPSMTVTASLGDADSSAIGSRAGGAVRSISGCGSQSRTSLGRRRSSLPARGEALFSGTAGAALWGETTGAAIRRGWRVWPRRERRGGWGRGLYACLGVRDRGGALPRARSPGRQGGRHRRLDGSEGFGAGDCRPRQVDLRISQRQGLAGSVPGHEPGPRALGPRHPSANPRALRPRPPPHSTRGKRESAGCARVPCPLRRPGAGSPAAGSETCSRRAPGPGARVTDRTRHFRSARCEPQLVQTMTSRTRTPRPRISQAPRSARSKRRKTIRGSDRSSQEPRRADHLGSGMVSFLRENARTCHLLPSPRRSACGPSHRAFVVATAGAGECLGNLDADRGAASVWGHRRGSSARFRGPRRERPWRSRPRSRSRAGRGRRPVPQPGRSAHRRRPARGWRWRPRRSRG